MLFVEEGMSEGDERNFRPRERRGTALNSTEEPLALFRTLLSRIEDVKLRVKNSNVWTTWLT